MFLLNILLRKSKTNNNNEPNYFDNIEQIINSDTTLHSQVELEKQAAFELYEKYELEAKTNGLYIKLRKNRDLIKHSFIIRKFIIGDVLEFAYFYKSAALTFSGICIAIKKKSFVLPDLSLILRNVIVQTGMELIYSYFYNRAYKQKFLDYKRKIFTFNKNKLYFIRDRLNRESRVF
jgi:ribosomal protein L19